MANSLNLLLLASGCLLQDDMSMGCMTLHPNIYLLAQFGKLAIDFSLLRSNSLGLALSDNVVERKTDKLR